MFDTVIVTGGKPGESFSGTSTLFGPFKANPVGQKLDPETDPVVGVATFEGTFDDAGNAEVKSTSVKFSEVGYYVWAEKINADVNHDESTWPDAEASETSLWIGLDVTSKVSAQHVLVGEPITDDVVVTGIQPVVGGDPDRLPPQRLRAWPGGCGQRVV